MWCVCSDKEGFLSIQSRAERETMISVLIDCKKDVPNFVVKVFLKKSDAENYIFEINKVNNLIKKIK